MSDKITKTLTSGGGPSDSYVADHPVSLSFIEPSTAEAFLQPSLPLPFRFVTAKFRPFEAFCHTGHSHGRERSPSLYPKESHRV